MINESGMEGRRDGVMVSGFYSRRIQSNGVS